MQKKELERLTRLKPAGFSGATLVANAGAAFAAKDALELAKLLRDLVDPEECHFDHEGYCQAHQVTKPCPHSLAKAWLTAHGFEPK